MVYLLRAPWLRLLIAAERFPSGQREQTVNLPAQPSEVRILPSPPSVIIILVGDSGATGDFRTIIAKYYTLPHLFTLGKIQHYSSY